MSDIKAGDLVMVVRPSTCCGNSSLLGSIFTVDDVFRGIGRCGRCGHIHTLPVDIVETPNLSLLASTLKKIDPPAEGDSLPTRKDLEGAT